MASFLGRRSSRLGFCGHNSFLIRRAFSSLTSPPALALTPMGRLSLRRVPALHTMRAPAGLQNLQVIAAMISSLSSVCLWSVCRVSVCLCMSIRPCPCPCPCVRASVGFCPCPCPCVVLFLSSCMSVCPVLSALSVSVTCEYRHARQQPRFEAVSAPKCG